LGKILLIIKRDTPEKVIMDDGSITWIEIHPHYELHFEERVEFWTLDNEKLGESNVEPCP
jgi:hypothetical protein